MRYFKSISIVLIMAAASHGCYWATLVSGIEFSDHPSVPPEAWINIFYMSDTLYYFDVKDGNLAVDYYGHCDLTNTFTVWAKGYYQKIGLIQDLCTRTILGMNPPPEPVVRCECPVILNPGPVADAGKDRYVNIYTWDTLDGSESVPFNGRSVERYHWRTRFDIFDTASVAEVVLNDSLTARPWFMLMVAGDYLFYLCVEDAYGLSAWDTVRVHACPYGQPCVDPASEKRAPAGSRVGLRVFPNPARGEWTVLLPPEARSAFLMDVKGRRIEACLTEGAGTMEWRPKRLFSSGVAGGVYFVMVTLQNGEKVWSRPFAVVK
jgi:hypothetical protein